MKKVFTILFFFVVWTNSATAQCTDAPFDQWPSSTFTPNCTGSPQTIVTNGYAGEYSSINVTNGVEYVFASSVSTDFLTISNGAGTSSFATGTGSVTWTATLTGIIRFYNHTNAECGTQNTNRTRSVSCPIQPPPANDDCANATTLTVNADLACGTSTMGTTVSATQSTATAPGCSATGVDDDVWYKFTATGEAHLIRITGATNITAAAVYSGACASLTQLLGACSSTSGGTLNLNLTGLASGTTYHVRVYTTSSLTTNRSNFTICVGTPPPPPANDECAGAIILTSQGATCSSPTNGTTASATQSQVACAGTANDDVWYQFTATQAAHNVSVVGDSGFDAVLEVFSGSCGSLTQIVCRDATGGGGTEVATLTTLTPGQTYYVRVHHWFSSIPTNTTFTICVTIPPPPPANDDCANATTLTVNADFACGTSTMGTTESATQSTATAPGCSATGVDDDVWYKFTATGAAHRITITGATNITAAAVYSGACASLTQLLGACSSTSGGTLNLNLTGLASGTTYHVRVYTTSSLTTNRSNFTICVGTPPLPPANDNCPDAIVLTPQGATCSSATNGTTASATQSQIGCSGFANDDVWYQFTATQAAHNVSVVGASGFDAVLEVFSGSCGSLTSIICQDATFSGGTETAVLTTLTPGQTYYVRVHHWSSSIPSNTTFTICVTTPIPPCTAPSTPVVSSIGPNSATISWDAVMGATSYDITIGTGASCPTGTSGSTALTAVNISGLVPNTTYRFCVRTGNCGGGAASGYATVTFMTAPLPNDNCSGAINISCNQTVSGSTIGATSDASMGSCGTGIGVPPGLGVWYRLQGDGSQVTASLCNSSYDTKIHIYEGSTCGSLVCVASNDDSSVCGSFSSRSNVVFNTNAGSTYYILVSGFGSATGAFNLQIGCVCGAPLGNPWTVSHLGSSSGEAIDNVCGGSIDITSSGAGTFSTDAQSMASQTICGNDVVTVKVVSINNNGHAGISFRESLDPGARRYSLGRNPGNGIIREIRTTPNTNVSRQLTVRPNHHWLRVVRQGNTFISYTSLNGASWMLHSSAVVPMSTCLAVGLYVQSPNTATNSTGVFSDLSFNAISIQTNQEELVSAIADEIKVFPNPSNGQFQMTFGHDWLGGDVTIQVVNIVGQVMHSQRINDIRINQISLQLDQLAAGTYLMQVTGKNGMVKTERLIIQ